ncbi:hypothetical protein [Stutzerimonas nitrititolerans]|uniref:hypothetical protein n=1 Tax=Stutzerimonas nitrititolerans TaxID=2482751 RepID=UPI002896F3C0|nr:hypothetical protein [Stutzerimonas nitrititolerans]
MNKWNELKRLAQEIVTPAYTGDKELAKRVAERLKAEFDEVASPEFILELMSSYEQLGGEVDRLNAENKELCAELREKAMASSVDAIAYRGVVYRVRHERAGTEIGPAGLQRMFLLGYNRSASLLQAMLARGDLAPIDGKPHCGFVHGFYCASAQEASHV